MEISIIMPVYNAERFLHRSIASVLRQKFRDWELIIVDDGSTDNSYAICEDYARNYSGIRLFQLKHQGQACARNYGLKVAKGEYISFLDADDFMHPMMLYTLHQDIVSRKADVAMVDFCTLPMDYCINAGALKRADIKEYVLSKDSADKAETDCKDNVYLWNKLYRRTLFENVRFHEGRFYEDTAMMHEIFEKANRVVKNPSKLYFYYQNKKGTVRALNFCKIKDCLWAYSKRLCFYYKKGYAKDLEHSMYMFLYKAYELYALTYEFPKETGMEIRKWIRGKVKHEFEKYDLAKLLPFHGKIRYGVFLYYPHIYEVYLKLLKR